MSLTKWLYSKVISRTTNNSVGISGVRFLVSYSSQKKSTRWYTSTAVPLVNFTSGNLKFFKVDVVALFDAVFDIHIKKK